METLLQRVDNHFLAASLGVGAIMGYLTLNALFLIWFERKVSAWIQRRMGPTEVGPFGLLQTVADMGKLLSKQLITPAHVDKPLYHLAPILVFMPVVIAPIAVSYIWKFIFAYEGPLNQTLQALGLEGMRKDWLAEPRLALLAVLIVMV